MPKTKVLPTRERIIQASKQLFWQRSYDDVSVDTICREAGVHKGSFYHFFPSKEALVMEVLDEIARECEEQLLRPSFTARLFPLDKIRLYFQNLQQQGEAAKKEFGHYPGCPIGNLAAELSTISDAVRQKACKVLDLHAEYFTQVMTEAQQGAAVTYSVPAEMLANLLVACWQGASLKAKAYNNPSAISQTIENFLNSMKSKHSR